MFTPSNYQPAESAAAQEAAKVTVIGIGNDFRCDDAVGFTVARAVQQVVGNSVSVYEASGGSFDLIDCWEGSELVIFIDAVSSGMGPGTVFRIDLQHDIFPSEMFFYSTHTFTLGHTLELAKLLGKLPPRILLFGIEGSNFAHGTGLTAEVAGAVEPVVKAIIQCIDTCLKSETQPVSPQK